MSLLADRLASLKHNAVSRLLGCAHVQQMQALQAASQAISALTQIASVNPVSLT
jgi:hypothetical protein